MSSLGKEVSPNPEQTKEEVDCKGLNKGDKKSTSLKTGTIESSQVAESTKSNLDVVKSQENTDSSKEQKIIYNNSAFEKYSSIVSTRYCNQEISYVFSAKFRYRTWRFLWFNLAKAQKELGLNITDAQLKEMEENIDNINFDVALQFEKKFKHDVMAHIHAYGTQCPLAVPIIHLGATSCYVTDNADLIILKKAFEIIIPKLSILLNILANKAAKYKSLSCLGYTHFQPAQLTTVGKRMCIWLQDMTMDLRQIIFVYDSIRFRGTKGTTGTQASFLKLFNGHVEKVNMLDERVTELSNFGRKFVICGQTYTRKLDCQILSSLAGLGSSMHKISTDIRLLSNGSEICEYFSVDQIGSSAMPYKQNPINLERCCSLSRRIMNISNEGLQTHALQWLERSLDDSAIRRIYLPESFVLADCVISYLQSIFNKIQVNEKIINCKVTEYLPFIITENIIMEMVKKGANRQECHEMVRKLSMQWTEKNKQGIKSDMIQSIKSNAYFNPIHNIIDGLVSNVNQYTGCSTQQVTTYLAEEFYPEMEAIYLKYKNIDFENKKFYSMNIKI